TRIEETERIVGRAESDIRAIVPKDELETINDDIGIPTFYNLAFVQTDNIGGQDADILIALEPKHQPTERYEAMIRERLGRDFPGCTFYFQAADIVGQVLNFGLPAPIDVQIEGMDLEASYQLALRLKDRLREIPGTVDVRIPQVLDYPALRVSVDRSRAAQIGLSEQAVANDLLTSLSSSALVAPSFWLNPKNNVNYFVAVQTPLPQMRSVHDLLGTPLAGSVLPPLGAAPVAPLPSENTTAYLGSVASLRPTGAMALINHYTVQRIIEVQAGVAGRDLGGVARDIQSAIHSLGTLPKGTHIAIRGQSQSMFESFDRLALGMLLAILLVYLLLVVLFQSWLDPLIIIVAVPGALVGILWMLALTHTTLNVESFMGAIMSVGIAVSNSILLVSFANDYRVQEKTTALAAALEAGRTRLRPVLMTALAMILGMLPMSLALGEGGEQNAPLGRAVIGGLCVATFVTLFVVPVVYSLLRVAPPRKHELDLKFGLESKGAEDDLPREPHHA
ncbi:MAG: efflux RND transporter permease subunit, partial [Deltaproteobacteria bacterium]